MSKTEHARIAVRTALHIALHGDHEESERALRRLEDAVREWRRALEDLQIEVEFNRFVREQLAQAEMEVER